MIEDLALNIDWGKGWTDSFTAVLRFVPQFIGFLVILAIGWAIAKAIARISDRVLRGLGSDRVAERSGITRVMGESGYDLTGIIAKVIYYAVLLIALQLAFGIFGSNPVSTLIHSIVAWLPQAIVAVIIFVVAMAIANAVRDVVGRVLSGVSYGRSVATVAWAFIGLIGLFAALGQAGIATSVTGPLLWAIVLTIAGIAVVGMGGGLIVPMRQRWERLLSTAERETENVRSGLAAYQADRDARGGRPQWYAGSQSRETTEYR